MRTRFLGSFLGFLGCNGGGETTTEALDTSTSTTVTSTSTTDAPNGEHHGERVHG